MTDRAAAAGLAWLLCSANAAGQEAQPQPGAPPTMQQPQPGAPPTMQQPQPGAPPTMQQPQPPAAPRPSAGGLTAPGALPAEQVGAQTATEQQLQKSREKDSGRGLTWFWFDLEGGYQYVALETFDVGSNPVTAGLVPAHASGGYLGAGLGLQLLFFRIGPRGRIGFFQNWQLYTAGGELGFRIPLGIFEPHLELGGGYAALGNMGGDLSAIAGGGSGIRGGYARIGAGLDFYLGRVFSIGPAASFDVMGLTRPGVSLSSLDPGTVNSLSDAQKAALAVNGSGYGTVVTIGAQAGLSF